jgi:F0F1-type ATP synthase membrane subunit b/b'
MIKNWAIVFLISSLLSALGLAQEHAPTSGSTPPQQQAPAEAASHGAHDSGDKHNGESGDPMIWWKWANFGILALALGYLASQHLPAFFAGRTAEIQKDLAEARQMKVDSDRKAAEMEQRMAKLGAEIENLRANSKAEIAAEGQRIAKETEASLAKLQTAAENEIESMTKAAKHELKTYSVQLAVDMAGERIRNRSGMEANLFNRFVSDLEKKGANN